MRAKHLLMATALLSFMASCNDDMVNEAADQGLSQNEIVGAELLANEATLSVGLESAASRTVNGQFELADQIGLAWFNAPDSKNTQNLITGSQTTKFPANNETDTKVYGIHVFQQEEANCWKSSSNVYAGAHFAYYPWVRTYGPDDLKLALKNEQSKADFAASFGDGSIYISPKKIFSKTDVTADNKINAAVTLTRLNNVLKFKVTPNKDFKNLAVLKDIPFTGVTLTANQAVFAQEVTVNPHMLLVDGAKGTTHEAMRATEMFSSNNNKAYKYTKLATSATTKITEEAGMTQAGPADGVYNIFMNVLPYEATVDPTTTTVKVSTKWGSYTFQTDSKKEGYNKFDKLNKFFANEISVTDAEGKTNNYGLSNVTAAQIGVNFDLSEADYTPSYTITNEADWYEALEVANALYAFNKENKEYQSTTFTVSNLNLKGDFLKEGFVNNVKITIAGTMTVSGKANFPAENMSFSNKATLTVAKGAELTIPACEKKDDVVVAPAKVNNHGTINVGYHATLNNVDNFDEKAKKEEDKAGRIVVEYGSYVTLVSAGELENKQGIIAYNFTNDSKPFMVNELMTTSTTTQQLLANVNTLMVGEGVTMDLAATSTVAGGEYGTSTKPGFDENLIKTAIVELYGGKLTDSSIKDDANSLNSKLNVKAVVAENGGTIEDVKASDSILAKAGVLTIDGKLLTNTKTKKTYKLDNETTKLIGKKGTKVIVNVDMKVNTLDNSEGHFVVEMVDAKNFKTITYTENYLQGGIMEGNVVKEATPAP